MNLYDIPIDKVVGTQVFDTDGTQGVVSRKMFDNQTWLVLITWMGKPREWHNWDVSTVDVHPNDPLYEPD